MHEAWMLQHLNSHKMKFSLIIAILVFSSSSLVAQKNSSKKNTSTSDTIQNVINTESPVKSLTKFEYDAYQNGDPMRFTQPAELNNYPSPTKALALEKHLKLTAAQKNQLTTAAEALRFKAKEMGRSIIQNEKKLYDLFMNGKIDEGSLIYFSNQYGLYQGELRNAHLQAHLKTKRILTPDQLKKISQQRQIQTKNE